MMNIRRRRITVASLVGFTGLWLIGCAPLIDPNVPVPIRQRIEPEHHGDYLLYRPSGYEGKFAWPLIVACHGAFPDSPNKQMRAWTQQAESNGFILVVPTLRSARGRPRKAPEQIELQRRDERHILATIQHVRAGHQISSDRIFIYGWSSGAYAALHVGMRHPDLFRAISVAQPKFGEGFLAEADDAIDPYQPIMVNYGVSDAITGKHGRSCVDWLRSHGARLFDDAVGTVRRNETGHAVGFFEEVVRKEPWIVIRAFPAADNTPLSMQFKLRTSLEPTRYLWEFGDGDTSPVAEPVHAYAAPGRYPLAVTVEVKDGARHRRKLSLKVP